MKVESLKNLEFLNYNNNFIHSLFLYNLKKKAKKL